MIRRNEISRVAFRYGVPEKTIQKDYVITMALRHLGPRMVGLGLRFKGGTCLKKAHFPEYRFSEDLDFTLEAGADNETVWAALDDLATALSQEGIAFDLGEPERGENGVTYLAKLVGPLGGADKLKIDVTTREMLVYPAVVKTLLDEYSDAADSTGLLCYSLEEIFLEKLVCLLDPSRIQPRDLYDLDRLLECGTVDVESVAWAFPDKARFKGLEPSRLQETLQRKGPQLRRRWGEQLAQQVPAGTLPGYDGVERRLMRIMREHGLT